MFFFLSILIYFSNCEGKLWPKGVVHYMIDQNDYDSHSQDVIVSTFQQLERELCIKFFQSNPSNGNASASRTDIGRVLLITNPDKIKDCPREQFHFTTNVVIMPIGYKCLKSDEIARIIVDMLRASIDESELPASSYDILKKFREKERTTTSLLSPADRNYINSYYFAECGALSSRRFAPTRRVYDEPEEPDLSYYNDKIWPLGIIMYGVEPAMRDTPYHAVLRASMVAIELATCLIFQNEDQDDVLKAKNLIWFSSKGNEVPALGFKQGNQSVSLKEMVEGAPGHLGLPLNNLLRAAGVPMMSNRYDRDNYVQINWKNVEKGKEYLLEKEPKEAWLTSIPYDFDSATHAPANFACAHCNKGETTVQPLQDHLWLRSLSMGHVITLSESDVKFIFKLYGKECSKRFQ